MGNRRTAADELFGSWKTGDGYSITRKRREREYRPEKLPGFDRIPSHKATLVWLKARYAFVEKSILALTEGLGSRNVHGRVILVVVNEHTASAGEVVSAFAEENNLAIIVGMKTGSIVKLSGSAIKLEMDTPWVCRLPPT